VLPVGQILAQHLKVNITGYASVHNLNFIIFKLINVRVKYK
jgi:hypothetical protein